MCLLDDAQKLIDMDRDELEEILLDPKYNIANLREMLRHSLGLARKYRDLYELERKARLEGEQAFVDIEERAAQLFIDIKNAIERYQKDVNPKTVLDVTFVSVWDDGVEVRTKAKYDAKNNVVFDIESIDGNCVEVLLDEYIELPCGVKLPIYHDPHAFCYRVGTEED